MIIAAKCGFVCTDGQVQSRIYVMDAAGFIVEVVAKSMSDFTH